MAALPTLKPIAGDAHISVRLKLMLAVETVALVCLSVVALDLTAHTRFDPLGTVNIWGYRGPIARAKSAKEVRIVVVGGTRAFGWGLVASQTIAPSLYTLMMLRVDRPGTDPPKLVTINLGRLGYVPGNDA